MPIFFYIYLVVLFFNMTAIYFLGKVYNKLKGMQNLMIKHFELWTSWNLLQ